MRLCIPIQTSFCNVAIGHFALRQGAGGSSRDYNVAIGQDAMRNANPHVSVAIGKDAGNYLKNGSYGVVHIGHEAGNYASASRNVFMGYQAGMGGTTTSI